MSHFIALAGGDPCQYRHKWYIAKNCGLHFRCRKYWRIFNHFYVIRPESYQIRSNYDPDMAITPFKVIQGHRVWYQSKAHCIIMRPRVTRYSLRYVKNRYIWLPLFFLSPDGRSSLTSPRDDLHNILPGCQRMVKIPNGVETLLKISTG